MTVAERTFGARLAEGGTEPKRYKLPRYVVERIREHASEYGSQGRAIQIGMELLSRIQYHPIPINEELKRRVKDADEHIGMTYKLVPRTIELIDKYAETQYKTRAHVFEAMLTMLTREFIA